MNFKSILVLASALTITAATSTALAEDVSLHVGGGATEQVNVNNANQLFTRNPFQLGESGDAKLLFNLTPNLSIGPQATAYYFQDAKPNNQPGVLWHFGAVARLQGSHDDTSWSPYVELGAGGAIQDHVGNPSLTSAVGIDFAVEKTGTYWMGPYASYSHVFDENSVQPSLLPNRDFNAVTIGISVTFDAPVKPKTVTKVVEVERKVEVKVPCPVCALPVVPAPARAPLRLTERVLFAKDSSTLTDTATTTLDQVVAKLNVNKKIKVVVQGSASSDGPKAHNLTLSHKRATVVVDYMVKAGIEASRLKATSTGAVGEPNDVNNRATDFIVIVLSQ